MSIQERTYIGELASSVGKEVKIMGWVDVRRDQGKLIFFDFRDMTGYVQGVILPAAIEAHAVGEKIRPEYVVEVVGKVNQRPEKNVQKEKQNGDIELEILAITILNEAETPPFDVRSDGLEINEEVRLKYRYLDLRRPRLKRNLKLRSDFIELARQFLFKKGFTEVETPALSAPTPEGSRDFIVPARLQPGKFFALPQSPQQYKQLLMVGGLEKYFQIARCFRDEDLRADRGFEHTQIDIEMSFVELKDVMALDEEMITSIVEGLGFKIKQKPFPIFTYQEAMEKFGADKFDLRSEEDKQNGILAYAWVIDFPFFEKDKEGNWTFTHNPFSMPKKEHIEWLLKGERIGEIITNQYDLVCNGLEVGGGSIRAHKPEILEAVFRVMGYDDEKIQEQFGHMLQAFKYGAPPHGGIAHGIERNIMNLAGETYLREVQAFPQTSSGRTSVMDAPSVVDKKQLDELGIKVVESAKEKKEDKK
jgi:aspartyl-tRNA synthetase